MAQARRRTGRRLPAGAARWRIHSRWVSSAVGCIAGTWHAAANSGSPTTRPKRGQRTGITNLKVGFNKVFGYYLEITNLHREKIPRRVHPQADRQERRALHHARAEGVRGKKSSRPDEKAKDLSTRCFSNCATPWPPRDDACKRPRPSWRSSTCWLPWPISRDSGIIAARRSSTSP